MPNVTYVEADGSRKTIDVPVGWSLMQGAVSYGVRGIIGECGGSCACATCHGYIDAARLAQIPPPDAGELDMLDMCAGEVRPNSRLCCQVQATTALEGLVVHLPASQG